MAKVTARRLRKVLEHQSVYPSSVMTYEDTIQVLFGYFLRGSRTPERKAELVAKALYNKGVNAMVVDYIDSPRLGQGLNYFIVVVKEGREHPPLDDLLTSKGAAPTGWQMPFSGYPVRG